MVHTPSIDKDKMRFLALLIIALLFPAIAFAGPLDDANAAYFRGDNQTAINLWRPLADGGNAEAQNWIGLMYLNGFGVQQNYEESFKWYRKAADQGYPDAQMAVGEAYMNGEGVKKDTAEAFNWFMKAAEQGDGISQLEIGLMYERGEVVKQDYVEALFWFSLAEKHVDGALNFSDNSFPHLTSKQIETVKKRAAEWKPAPASVVSTKP